MKKSIGFIFLAIMFSFIAVFVPTKTKEHASAANVRKSVKLEFEIAENKNEDEFSVRVYLNENPGICSLSMELSYDSESMMLASYTKGSGLKNLELDTPEDEEPDGYAHTPFTFDYSGKKANDYGVMTYENDTSTGVLFLMRFKLREGAADKEYKVTFINVEAGYYDSQALSVEESATATEEVKIQVVGGKVTYEETKNNPSLMDRKTVYIDDLCVDATERGQHIGTALYDYVKGEAKKEGCSAVTLNVWCLNTGAMRFYEKCGMKPLKVVMEDTL